MIKKLVLFEIPPPLSVTDIASSCCKCSDANFSQTGAIGPISSVRRSVAACADLQFYYYYYYYY